MTRAETNEGREKKWGAGGAEKRDTVPLGHRTPDIRGAAPAPSCSRPGPVRRG